MARINDQTTLPNAPASGDVFAVESGGTTYKIDYNALATAIIGKLGGDPATVAHGGTGATSAGNARKNLGIKFAIYNSVSDLGLTAGSATILSAFNAMSDNSILITAGSDFVASEMPDSVQAALVEIRRLGAARTRVLYYGKGESNADYVMYEGSTTYNGNQANAPTGVWRRVVVNSSPTEVWKSGAVSTNTVSGPNLDDLKYAFIGRVSNATNGPSGINANGGLLVIPSAGLDNAVRVIQVFISMDVTTGMYVRSYNGSSWTTWKHLTYDGDKMAGTANPLHSINVLTSSSGTDPSLFFKNADASKSESAIYNLTSSHRLLFREWRTTDTSNYENYYLPAPAASGTSNPSYDILTTKQSVTNATIGNSTYIDTIAGGYIRLGRVVVFSVQFKVKSAIASSVANAISGMASALYRTKFLVNSNSKDDTDMTRVANIDGTSLTLKGSFTSGSTYNISGAYLSAS